MAFHVFSYWLFTAFQWSAFVALSPNTPYSFAAESSVSIRYLPTSRAYSFYHSLSLELTPAHRHFSLLLIFQILQFAQILIADLQHFVSLFKLFLCDQIGNLSLCVNLQFGRIHLLPLLSALFWMTPYWALPRHPRSPLVSAYSTWLSSLSPHMHPSDSATPNKDFCFLPDFDFTHSRLFHGIVRRLHSPDLLGILPRLISAFCWNDIHIINGRNICIRNKNFDSKSYKNITMLFISRE